MKHILGYSGGKDSTALLCWAKEHLEEWEAVFCDTGWEHPMTYAYIEEVNQTVLHGQLRVLRSAKYDGFADLALRKKVVPSMRMRFCTEELKIKPLHAYFDTIDDEITSYQGIRADESAVRAKMGDETWVDDAGGYLVKRPLYRWTAEACFALSKRHGIRPNPLYLLGAARVGCWPCVMISLGELKRLYTTTPGLHERIVELEAQLNRGKDPNQYRTFFHSSKIPPRYCTQRIVRDGKEMFLASAEDVYNYLMWEDEDQLKLFDPPGPSCMSVYNLCE